MKTKTFDCVQMKRRAAERIYKTTKEMTLEQKIQFWKEKNQSFRQEVENVRKVSGTTGKPS